MSVTLVLAALAAAAQLTSTPGAEPATIEQREVAYEAIAAGRADEAIRAIEVQLATDPDDPALLINLGAAYARGKLLVSDLALLDRGRLGARSGRQRRGGCQRGQDQSGGHRNLPIRLVQ